MVGDPSGPFVDILAPAQIGPHVGVVPLGIGLAFERPAFGLVGFARLALADVKAAKLGYAIRGDRWDKGYATDATRRIVAFGFAELRLRRISAAIGPDNAASIAVVQKLEHRGPDGSRQG
jgi:RimJ/RimL family protein N-acetyltransferase